MQQACIGLRTSPSEMQLSTSCFRNFRASMLLREGTLEQASVDRHHRNKNGRIARKYGNSYIRTLRVRYGAGFAAGELADSKLIAVLRKLDEGSLQQLIEDL